MSNEATSESRPTLIMPPEPSAEGGARRLVFGTIQNKIVLPFLLLTVLVTSLGTFVVTRLVATDIQSRLTTQLLETSRAASDRIVAWESFQLDTLRLVAFTVGVPQAMEAGDEQFLTDALVALAANQNVYLVLATDLDGNVIASARQSADGYDTAALNGQSLAEVPSVAHVLAGDSDEFGDKYAGVFTIGDESVLLTVAPILGTDAQLAGAIAMGTPLREVLGQTKVETLADLSLFAPDGKVIETTFAPDRQDTSALDITPELYNQTIAASESETPLAIITLNLREFQTAYVPLVIRRDELGVLGVSWPSTLVTSAITTNRNGLAVMFAVVAVCVVLVGYAVAHNLTQPIRRLAEVAQAVATGDLSQQSKVRTADEIGVLGRVFDQMTLNLHEKTEALIHSYQEQEKESAFLSAVIASAGDGTVVVDPAGRIIRQNPVAQEIIARDEAKWQRTVQELSGEMEASGSAPVRLEVDGFWYEAIAAPVMTPAREEVGVVITLRDITDQVLTDRMRTAFILQMSHELYTPLLGARGNVELAKVTIGQKVPLAVEWLDRTLESLRQLNSLINQIIDVSRMIRGGFEIEPEVVDLRKLLLSVIGQYDELVKSKKLHLQVDIGALQPYTGGRDPLRWAFKHLVNNACDYTLPGGTIRITAADEPDAFVLKVRDTGVGIARHEKPHIFEQFFRGRPIAKAPDGTEIDIDIRGAGLGLFVVDQVVRAHGGTISVWSEPGIGSEFVIRLPREGAALAEAPPVDTGHVATAQQVFGGRASDGEETHG